jgi:phenylalanyl-tRNA synthetase beta subunit
MKVAVEWLQEQLSKSMSAQLMANALEAAGVELEQIISSKKLDQLVISGIVKKVVQHPGADKLKLATVGLGEYGERTLVCGAPNIRAGLRVAVALPEARLNDGSKIEPAVIRGIKSEGMICSARELGIGDDHLGVLELPEETKAGVKLCDIWPKGEILDIKTAANRSDLQSIIGLAREIAAIKNCDLKMPADKDWPGNREPVTVRVDAAALVPRYMVGDLVVKEDAVTPEWMKQRLVAAGMRPINVIVDVTNYVMLETGQPLHAYDATKVKLLIVVRQAKPDEKIKTLDGTDRKLTKQDLVIADASGPIAIAGIMGGVRTEVSDSTRRIILEAATFDGASVRKAARRHNLRTEASARFERRLPVQLAPIAIRRAAQLLIEVAGAQPSGGLVDQLQVWPWVQHIGVRPSRVSRLFGREIKGKTIVEHLQRLGFEAEVFDIANEARKHLGKPYKWGASFKADGESAFDCSYLVDRIYSKIGVLVGHTALGQFEKGLPVHTGELTPGDVVFYEGKIEKSTTDHYYTLDENHKHVRHELKQPKKVGHNGIFVGSGKVVMAAQYSYDNGYWVPMEPGGVVEVPLEIFTENPTYLGARRYVDGLDDFVSVTVPWWRPDVRIEEDILEEVARIEGYSELPATLPAWRPSSVEPDRRWPLLWSLKSALRGLGLFEVMTYSFVSGEQLKQVGLSLENHLKLKNPRSSEQEYLRNNMMPSLLAAVESNKDYGKDFGIYEVSKVFMTKGSGQLPDEPLHLALAIRQPQAAYEKVKAAVDLIAREFKVEFDFSKAELAGLHPAKGAAVRMGKVKIGIIGEVHPDVLRAHKISGSLGYLELDWDRIAASTRDPQYQPVSRFPSVYRDLSLIVKDNVAWAAIQAVLKQADVLKVQFLSEYRGEELPNGSRAVALRLEMSELDRTLTDAEADKRSQKIVRLLESEVGVKIKD